MSIRCGYCRHVVLESAEENIFFFVKDSTQVHIAVKPERLLLIKQQSEDNIKFVAVTDVSKRKKKNAEIRCGKCDGVLGAICPFGPGN
eukprot:11241043-Ditylum_brightwellii.AAC.1